MEAKLEESTEQLKNMKAEIERLENGWEMKCPYKNKDSYFIIDCCGGVSKSVWACDAVDKTRFSQGDIFQTRLAAELEEKRRNLLTRFRAFRNECNGDWKADWKNAYENKYFICEVVSGLKFTYPVLEILSLRLAISKIMKIANDAIELFGDEIKNCLWKVSRWRK